MSVLGGRRLLGVRDRERKRMGETKKKKNRSESRAKNKRSLFSLVLAPLLSFILSLLTGGMAQSSPQTRGRRESTRALMQRGHFQREGGDKYFSPRRLRIVHDDRRNENGSLFKSSSLFLLRRRIFFPSFKGICPHNHAASTRASSSSSSS